MVLVKGLLRAPEVLAAKKMHRALMHRSLTLLQTVRQLMPPISCCCFSILKKYIHVQTLRKIVTVLKSE